MSWLIKCTDENCQEETWADNIVDLIDYHRDKEGWFVCRKCNKKGYIEKSFSLQEENQTWDPYLHGIIPLGDLDDTYQPFVFLVGDDPDGISNSVWFSYFKDLREQGGKLKLGYGPGGPPVLGKETIKYLLLSLKKIGYFTKADLEEIINSN